MDYIILTAISFVFIRVYITHKELHDLINKTSDLWIKYDWKNGESYPPTAGRYLIYRYGCDKIHFEHWNGHGWASSNNDCTHWRTVKQPTI